MGTVTTYYCKDNKKCPAILRAETVNLRGEETGTSVVLKKNCLDHIHSNVQPDDQFTKRGLSSAVKDAAM